MRMLKAGDARKIMVRATNWIGDAVMTTPALGALRSAFPLAEIVVVANPPVSELLSEHPFCDRVIVYDKKGPHRGFRGLLRFSSSLAEQRFDLAILFQNAIEAAMMARFAGIGKRAGYRTDCRGMLLTHPVPINGQTKLLHHVRYYLNALEKLGIPVTEPALRLHCTEEEKNAATKTLGGGRWVAINAGAAFGSAKRWYPERFAAVADALASMHGFNILLVGGPAETSIGAEIEAAMKTRPKNLVGRTTVREMMALLSLMELVVTNDSGPMHVAAAFDRPIVALFGSTDHTTTSPFCSKFKIVRKQTDCAPCLERTCPREHHRCMAEIGVEDVLEAAASLLGTTG